jgi:FKBP-type peptidyl-prolyl cis-trans isomerase
MPLGRKPALIILAFALLLGGCGGDSSSTEETASLRPFRITNRLPTVREESKMHLGADGLSGPEPKPIMPKGPPPEFLAEVDLSEGIGRPREGTAMTVQYVGYDYETGEKLVSSWDEGKPLTFTRGKGEVIQGWEEALVGMEGGDRREVVVPPDLAKGSKPPGIPPGKTVVFLVEPVPLKSGWKPLIGKSLGKTKPKVGIPKGPLPKNVVKIKDLKEGKGPAADGGDEVTVDYVGVLYKNGRQFDSSWDRGESLTFQLGSSVAIAGWEQALGGMKVGGRRELIVPSALGYGPQGAASIPPNSSLVYVIDLTAIN